MLLLQIFLQLLNIKTDGLHVLGSGYFAIGPEKGLRNIPFDPPGMRYHYDIRNLATHSLDRRTRVVVFFIIFVHLHCGRILTTSSHHISKCGDREEPCSNDDIDECR